MAPFDTLQFADGLKAAGTPAAQAEATARLLGDALALHRADLPPWVDAVEARFDGVEDRLDGVEHRLDGVEHRLDGVEHRLDGVEHRLDAVEHRLDAVEHRLDAVEHRLDGVEHRLDAVERRLDAVERRLDAVEHRLDAVEAGLEKLARECAVLVSRVDLLHGDMRWVKGMLALLLAGMLPLTVNALALLTHGTG